MWTWLTLHEGYSFAAIPTQNVRLLLQFICMKYDIAKVP